MKIYVHEGVNDDVKKLEPYIVREVDMWLDKLTKNPYLGQELQRELKGLRKIYLNKARHRIVYTINKQEVHILVIAIGARKDSEVYRIAKQRMDSLGEGR
jgi:mRNA-degrading endonuclease RelE of RelBE toxin-antitoxin system